MADVQAGQASQLAPGTGMVVSADGRSIALFNVGGTFYAIANECTHVGGPLGKGQLARTAVTCPWHGSQFDVTSGQVTKAPACQPLGTRCACRETMSSWRLTEPEASPARAPLTTMAGRSTAPARRPPASLDRGTTPAP